MMKAKHTWLAVCSVALGAVLLRTIWTAEHPAIAGPAPADTPATAPLPATMGSKLGINLEEVIDYARAKMFVDAMKSARRFGSPEAPWDEKAPVDKDGWPTADAGTCAITGLPNMGGLYNLSCTGRADVGVVQSSATVVSQQYDRKANKTTAQIKVADDATQLFLSFKNTAGGVRDIKLLRPGYAADTTQVFTDDFLKAIKPFSCLRLMDYLRTNKTTVADWADRAKPTDALQSSNKGAAYEYAIQLANQTGKDLWVNIPDAATPDYIRQLAKLLKSQLKPERAVYLEYSNEVWNSMFPQFHHNHAAATAEVKAGDNQLNDGGADTNQWYWGWKRVGKKAVEISKIFREVYGDAAMNKTVRVVLASHVAQPMMLRMQLEYIEKYHGAPSKFLYGVAGAPYFGLPEAINKRNDLTVDEILDTHVPNAITGWCRNAMFSYTLLAKHYKLASLCYEGGPGLDGEASVDAKIAANRDPRMGPLLETYFKQWYEMGGDTFMYFALSGGYSKYGCWGMTEDITKDTVKTLAMAKIAAEPLPKLKAGYAVPGEIPATKPDLQNGGGVEKGPDGGENIGYIRDGNTFDYMIDVPTPGKYKIALKTAAQGEGSKINVLVNGDLVGTIAPAGTGDWQKFAQSTSVEAALKAGPSVLRLQVERAGVNLRSVVVQKADGQAGA